MTAPAKPLRIAHFTRNMTEPGGIATYIASVSSEQVKRGNDVTLFDVCHLEGSSAHNLGPSGNRARYVRARDEQELTESLESGSFDLVHMHLGLEHNELPNLPVVRTVHGHQPYCPSGTRYLARSKKTCDYSLNLPRCLVHHFTSRCGSARPTSIRTRFTETIRETKSLQSVICLPVSDWVRDECARSGYDTKNFFTLRPPVSAVAGQPKLPGPHAPLAFLGRVVEVKGLQILLQSLAMGRYQGSLVVGGDGPFTNAAQRLTKELGLDHRVDFRGWLSRPELALLLEEVQAVIIPSLWPEPMGLSALEAMAHGRPTIVSNVGGLASVIKYGAGAQIVEPGDVRGLSEAIDRLTDVKFVRASAEAAFKFAKDNFGMDQHVDALDHFYALALQRNRGS